MNSYHLYEIKNTDKSVIANILKGKHYKNILHELIQDHLLSASEIEGCWDI